MAVPADPRGQGLSIRAEKLVWLVFTGLFLWNYLPTFKWMVMRWEEPGSYMSHGWLIPPISAFLVWKSRKHLEALPKGPSPAGFLVLAASLLVHIVAGLADVSSISGLTLIPALLGFVLLRFGWPVAKALLFPIFFLFFMVPPPEFVISGMNFTLKLLAADLATSLLNLTGMPAIRQGSFMIFGAERLAIGDVCSGLRSLLALLSLSVLYAWLIRDKGRIHLASVLLTALPAAIIGNGIRIFLVAYLVHWAGADFVFKPIAGDWDLHLLTGAIIFIAAFGCLYLVTVLLDRMLVAGAGKKLPDAR